MLDFGLLLRGIGIGILFSAPIGPVNIMCIQRAFRRGFLGGLAAGIGAVCADGLFAAIAAYGITAILGFVEGYSRWLQGLGGVVLILFGWRIARSHPHLDTDADAPTSIVATALASFGVTVTNPATVLGFIAVFGSLGDLAPSPGDYLGATTLVIGVLAGGFAWWVCVSGIVSLVRQSMTDRSLEHVNRFAGALLIVFGAAMIGRLVWLFLAA